MLCYAKSLQSCLTLCNPIDGSPPGSPIPGILQARILEWAAISFSNAWKWKVKVKLLSRVRLLVTPWTAAYQAPPSMGFSKQEYWSGVPLPSPRGRHNNCKYLCTKHRSTSMHNTNTSRHKRRNESNTIIVGNINTPLTSTDRSWKQKITKETKESWNSNPHIRQNRP